MMKKNQIDDDSAPLGLHSTDLLPAEWATIVFLLPLAQALMMEVMPTL